MRRVLRLMIGGLAAKGVVSAIARRIEGHAIFLFGLLLLYA